MQQFSYLDPEITPYNTSKMKTSWTILGLVAAVQAQKAVQAPITAPVPNADTSQGCFSSEGDWKEFEVEGMSRGSCKDKCQEEGYLVTGLGGATCYCGDNYPPEDDLVDDKKCDYPCPAYSQEACGGIKEGGFYSVFNNGIKMAVPNKEAAKESSTTVSSATGRETAPSNPESSSSSTATSAPQESGANNEDGSDGDDGGPSVGGIIGGVVAGVVIIAIGAGVGFWWFRRRRNHDIEEEHRRNAAVNSFMAGAKPPGSSGGLSMTDSRMDPVLAHRRMSDGSIADNQDYSRKILRVTNA